MDWKSIPRFKHIKWAPKFPNVFLILAIDHLLFQFMWIDFILKSYMWVSSSSNLNLPLFFLLKLESALCLQFIIKFKKSSYLLLTPLDKPRGASSTISRIDQFYVFKRLDKKGRNTKISNSLRHVFDHSLIGICIRPMPLHKNTLNQVFDISLLTK